MEIKKTAQQALFKELSRNERENSIEPDAIPQYNGYYVNDLFSFQENLDKLFDDFQKEIADNLTSRSPSLEIYLIDNLKSIEKILKQTQIYRKEYIENRERFKNSSEDLIEYFVIYQSDIITKVQSEITQKLEIVKNPDLFKPIMENNSPDSTTPLFKNKIQSDLSKVELTTLLWLLAEAKIFKIEWNDTFVKFVQDNFQFRRKESQYDDMIDIGPEIWKLRTNSETDRDEKKSYILELLTKTHLPHESEPSVLKKRDWNTEAQKKAILEKKKNQSKS